MTDILIVQVFISSNLYFNVNQIVDYFYFVLNVCIKPMYATVLHGYVCNCIVVPSLVPFKIYNLFCVFLIHI